MKIRANIAATTAAIASLVACGSALAASPLAQYSQLPGDGGYSVQYTNGDLSAAAYPVQFSFQTAGLPTGNLDAALTLNATAQGAAYQQMAFGQTYDIQGMSGNFSFVYTGATPLHVGTHTYTTGTVLLGGTFSGAALYGQDSGSTGSLTDSMLAGGTVNFTSGISQIVFSPGSDEGLSLALNSVSPFWTISGSNLGNFSATSAGNFAADVTISGGGGGVPEASAWVIMMLGFGVAGAQIRRRNAKMASV